MATPDERTSNVAPDDPVATHSIANPNATAGDQSLPASDPTTATPNAIRYVLGHEIARGGMGVVYRATDTTLGREVAVKVLSDKFGPDSAAARRFADEARIAGQLQHPAIPPVHDLGNLPDGRPFLAMKLIQGDTLDALLAQRLDTTRDHGRFVAVFEQACQALALAHARDVIHRDLKPANVMVGSFGEVQVMDWGLAKVLGIRATETDDPDETRGENEVQGPRDSNGQFTQAGSILGTPAFMPPEQAIGAIDQVDKRSDVFGLGGILCVILTGRAPFVEDTAESARQAAAKGKVSEAFARLDASGADPQLVSLCKQCLAPEKDDRPADAARVASAVAELRMAADERARRAELERVQLEGERAATEARASERRQRRRLAFGATIVLMATVVGGLAAVLLVQRRANANLAAKNAELADERAKVERRFELAQKAVATLHTGVSEDFLLKSDQFKELRTQLLKQAAGFYGDLEKLLESQDDAKSRRLLAAGYFQLGELTRQIGSESEALAVHRKALAIRRELASAAGADVETRLDVARSLKAMGSLMFFTGNVDEALRAYSDQHDVAVALETESPTKAVRAVLASSLYSTANVLRNVGKSTEAIAANEQAVAILRELVDANPADADLQGDLAAGFIVQESLFWDLGKWTEQMESLENARALLRKLTETNPAVVRYRYRLTFVYNNIGSTLFDMGKPVEALTDLQKGRDIIKKLADDYPAVNQYPDSLAYMDFNIGRALADIGKPSEAMAAFENSRAILQKLTETNPRDPTTQHLLGFCYNQIGELLWRQGKPNEALQFHTRAKALLLKQTRTNLDLRLTRGELASSLEHIGLLFSASGKTKEALAACEEAVAIRQKLSDAQPALAWLRSELAGALSVLGTVQRQAGQPAKAAASLRRGVALLEKLPMLTPRDLYNLACWHAQLANIGSDRTPTSRAAEANRAMTGLRQAISAGFGGVVHLRHDTSLDVLRPREDFQTLVKELEEKTAKALEGMPLPRLK
jgi:serine/threonine protein kinase